MFHFPAFPPTSLYIQLAVTHHEDEPGFPIRKSSDQRPVIGSPRLIADSHVLHRLLMPRHPPCALNNLQNTQIIKKNYSSNNLLSLQSKKTNKKPKNDFKQFPEDARVHYTVLKQQPTHTNKNNTNIVPIKCARQNQDNKQQLAASKPNNAPHPKN